ncbi:PIN domain-containing protein [Hymenobacter weizhouensis]|uniref:PIN domain-containing protein n=1 Tax=Hymenobacter sp. YIM 151500-1 TaxID=2987689 RepID=UPI002227F09C|nr:PIN domain-containing protein [Hymenobacter sp. YIM 151500-1]UYZ64998.1 PIN domain-containing protein [Hymenobacter sp. YIM 151500-1]
MSGKVFFDTNVLLYAYSVTEPQKQAIAAQVMQTPLAHISTQVLAEFANICRRKYGYNWTAVENLLTEVMANFFVHTNTPATLLRATQVAQRYGFSWFDSLIVAAALECGCQTLYSEDLQHGQRLDNGLQVLNPFV